MSKKTEKAARAAALRKELGLDDGEAGPVESAPRRPVQKPGPTHAATPAQRKIGAVAAPKHDDHVDEGRAASKPGLERQQVLSIDPKHWPRKHKPEDLKRGTSVWYRGERFFTEFCPSSWDKGCYARISEHRIHPDKDVGGIAMRVPGGSDLAHVNEKGVGSGAPFMSFCVHPDTLSLAPVVGSVYAAQPTLAGVARKERTARGEKDVGDPVAVMLRDAKTPDQMYATAAKFLGVPEKELRAKYGHLNAGQQRMNCGNRMRAKWKKEQR